MHPARRQLLFGGWHVIGGLSRREAKTETPIADEGSFKSDGLDAGVKWVAGAGSSIGFVLRTHEGRYVDRPVDPVSFLGDRFQRDEAELAATLIVTGRSTIHARLAHVEYYEHPFSQRDFSGQEARLGWTWTPAGRLSFTLDAGRTLSPWRDSSATYKADQRLSAGASWQVAARTTFTASLARGRSSFHQPIVAPPESRRDTDRSAQVGASWRVLRTQRSPRACSACSATPACRASTTATPSPRSAHRCFSKSGSEPEFGFAYVNANSGSDPELRFRRCSARPAPCARGFLSASPVPPL